MGYQQIYISNLLAHVGQRNRIQVERDSNPEFNVTQKKGLEKTDE
jgi:hypothetical protein